jgi:DNA processing protein
MALDPETRDLLALNLVPGIGPKLMAALLRRFGSAAGVLRARRDEMLQVPHLGATVVDLLQKSLEKGDVEKEAAALEEHQTHLLRLGQPGYPMALANIFVPPQLLYVRGEMIDADQQAVAIVGSRACTSYGKRQAELIAGDLARAGFTIVSGLARGIDGHAHRGALDAGGRTIAVLAGGLAKIYPPEHADLADEVAQHGALLSESALRMAPLPGMFHSRNRIISGLCRAVVIVEANQKSGALITAGHALEQGREIFAVPGNVDSLASAGTLQLLRQGARLVRSASDILEDLEGIAPLTTPAVSGSATRSAPARAAPTGPPPGLEDRHRPLWDFLTEPRHVEELADHCQTPMAEMIGLLMNLELKKVVRRLPGNMYERW